MQPEHQPASLSLRRGSAALCESAVFDKILRSLARSASGYGAE
jgi:hypothetical protein